MNGSVWSSLGSQMNAQVNSIAFDKAGISLPVGLYHRRWNNRELYREMARKHLEQPWQRRTAGYIMDWFDISGATYTQAGILPLREARVLNYIAKWNGAHGAALAAE